MKMKNLLIITSIMITIFMAKYSLADSDSESAATLSYIEGKVEIRQTGKTEWEKAHINMELHEGDSIKTGSESRARLVLEDDSNVMVGKLSVFTIDTAKNNYETNKKTAQFTLNQGKARAKTGGSSTPDSSFEIKTPTAIAGVRGTDFVVEAEPDENGESTVTVLDGTVEVGETDSNTNDRLRVEKGDTFSHKRGRKGDKPRKQLKDRLDRLEEEMTRNKDRNAPGVSYGMEDDEAATAVTLRRARISGERKKKILEEIESGGIPARHAKKLLILSHFDVSEEDVDGAIETAKNHELTDEDVDNFAQEIKKAKNKDEKKISVENFNKKMKNRKERKKSRKEMNQKNKQNNPENDSAEKFQKIKEKKGGEGKKKKQN